MWIKRLQLSQFRNYDRQMIEPGPGLTVFTGQNAQGKTNVLEAIHLCCVGRSHRTPRDEEMIRWGNESASVHLQTEQLDGTHEVSVQLNRNAKKKKMVRIGDRQAERIGELMGHVCGVLFSPEDLQIIKSGPSERRRFLDMQLSQLYPSYFYSLQKAVRALNQRNALLKEILKKPSLVSTLDMWDEELAEHSAKIVVLRRVAAEILEKYAQKTHAMLTGGAEQFSMRYVSCAAEAEDPKQCLLERLSAGREEDLRRCVTGSGIHRDDLAIFINGKEARIFASQGQQRSAVLSLKMAQLELACQVKDEAPVLMLDDVMSELDPQRRCQLIERIDQVQTFVTCTDLSDLAGAKQGHVYSVQNGSLTEN